MPKEQDLPTNAEWFRSSAMNPDDFMEMEFMEMEDIDLVAPMTDEQSHKLKALSWRLGVPFDRGLTRMQAEERIRELENRS